MPAPVSPPQRRHALRICLVVPYDLSPQAGGVKQHALHLMAHLQALGDEVCLIGPASRPVTEPHQHGFGGIITVRGNGSQNRMALWASPGALARFFRQRPFDVVHMHEPEVPALTYWAAALTPRSAKVATFHAFAERHRPHVQWVRRQVGRILYRPFQRAIAVSPGAARLAQGGWGRPLDIVPNGVDHRLFHPPRSTECTAPTAARPLKLLFVGGLDDPRKGAKYLLAAMAALRAQGLPVCLDMVGRVGPQGPPTHVAGVRHHQNVTTARLAELYRQADVLVAPATGQESFGIILLEAMASGKPIIASDIEGFRHVLTGVGPAGARFVPPKDAEALMQAIAHFIHLDPASRMAMGAANRAAIEPFTWDSVTARIRAIYCDVLALHRRP